ncbi:MAG: aconitase X catalytic domain-containing protein [Thermoprotei archaeon]
MSLLVACEVSLQLKLFLSKEEEHALGGEKGPAVAKAMEILVALGKIYDAQRLIPCTSAQISGVSYKNIGAAGADFLWDFAQMGAKAVIPSYINPAGMDLERSNEMNLDEDFVRQQLKIVRAYAAMGVKTSLTCAPYQIGVVPGRGEHVSWAESSAVIYANSVLGAMTNRESGVSALCSAVTGLTPLYGLHLQENRKADLKVKVECELSDTVDYALMGLAFGKRAGPRLVAFEGIRPTKEDMKALGAALASTGSVPMFFVKNVTPEWSVKEDAETMTFSRKELEEEKNAHLESDEDYDVITLGCPHASIDELARIASVLKGRILKKPLYVYTARAVKKEADDLGYTAIIENAGGTIFCDTCMVVSPINLLGHKSLATASGKAAHYSPTMSHVGVRLLPLEKIILSSSVEAA